MDRARKKQRTEIFVVTAQGGDGTIHVLKENLGEEHTVGDVKTALSRQTEMSTETQQLYVVNDKRDGIEETGGELEDDELLGAVIHYNPIFYSTKRLELVVTNFELEEWEILVKLRDDTGCIGWSNKSEGGLGHARGAQGPKPILRSVAVSNSTLSILMIYVFFWISFW